MAYTTWAEFRASVSAKVLSYQYEEDANGYYIHAYDGPAQYDCLIYKGAVSDVDGIVISQAQNDIDKADWETNYKPYANFPLNVTNFDPRNLHRFGNLNSLSVNEVVLASGAYAEPASQGQRSIVSTNAQDNPAGTGAKAVRITYLDSTYAKATEDITLNGTTPVNTVSTTIRFIESIKVIQGASAAGTISLMTLVAGGGTAICSIASATEDTFLCHHYVPAGMRAWIKGWGLSVSNNVNTKLKGQVRYGANLVDVNFDLENVTGVTAGGRANFNKTFSGLPIGEKTYVRVTVVPGQATSTVIRGTLDLWEDKSP